MVIATWNNHTFRVDPSQIYTFTDLTAKGSSDTEDKGKKFKYVKRKGSKPYELSFTIKLDKRLGIDNVRSEVTGYLSEANNGKQSYITFNGTKLFLCKFMLTEASASKIEIAPNGEWISCDLKITLKNSTKLQKEKTTSKKKSSSSSKKKSTSKKKKSSANTTSKKKVGGIAVNMPNARSYINARRAAGRNASTK